MAWERSSYDDVSQEMMPGDVIAFGGRGVSSRIIKLATRSPVSHVAAILEFARPKDGEHHKLVIVRAAHGEPGPITDHRSCAIAADDIVRAQGRPVPSISA